jgi:cation diffusion facilitator CzcD-associated flavoprotein CzcO
MTRDESTPILIVGAGPAGLAATHELCRRGFRPRVIDGARRVAEPWRGRHEALKLNTHRACSSLPGLRLPRRLGAFPRRDDYVAYLEAYERTLPVTVEWAVRVGRLDPIGGGWCVETSKGPLHARHVVLATGPDREPIIPAWPGRDRFAGELIHAGRFRRGDDYAGQRVLIVGGGNSGVDVASCLAPVATRDVWISVRSGPVILPRRLFGIPLQPLAILMRHAPRWYQDASAAMLSRLAFGDLGRHGMPAPRMGALTRFLRDGVSPAIDDGFVAALQAGRIQVVPDVEAFEQDVVRLVDGRTLRPDAVICATGYRRGLEPMVGHLGVLDDVGRPDRVGGAASPERPGLWFVGQRSNFEGYLYARGREARGVARAIRHAERRRQRRARAWSTPEHPAPDVEAIGYGSTGARAPG